MQLEYITDKKKYGLDIKNADVLKYVIKALFDILDELARAIQKIVERVTFYLGDEAGEDFVIGLKND